MPVDAADVLDLAGQLEYFSQGHALPQALTQRLRDIEALHRLEELHAVPIAQRLQCCKVDGRTGVELALLLEVRGALADNFQPPGLARQPRLAEVVALEGMRFRIA